jgi:hypothetical protein
MEDSNSTSNNELEQKKWLVSRIDNTAKLLHEELMVFEKRFDGISQKNYEQIISKRNEFWTALGAILSILVGLNTNLAPVNILYILIGITLGSGVIVYFLANWIISKSMRVFDPIQDQLISAQDKMNQAYGFIISKTLKIIEVKIETLDNYHRFLYVLGVAVRVPIYLTFKKYREENQLDDIEKNELLKAEEDFRGLILKVFPSEYQLNKDELPKTLVDYIKNNLELTVEKPNI